MRLKHQIYAITRTTVVEAIQQPLTLLLLLTSVLMTLLVPIFQFHRFSEDGRLARDSGLSSLLICGLVLAVTVAGRSIAVELKRGTMAAAIGKPVSRGVFLVAKWLGVVVVLAFFWIGSLSALMIAERASAHFVVREHFSGYVMDSTTLSLAFCGVALALLVAAVRHAMFQRRFGVSAFIGVTLSQLLVIVLAGFYSHTGEIFVLHEHSSTLLLNTTLASTLSPERILYCLDFNWRVLAPGTLVLFVLLLFSALATALVIRMQTGTALITCLMVLFASVVVSTLSQTTTLSSPITYLLQGLFPDIQNFWLCDAIARGGRVSWVYVLQAGGYTLSFCLLLLLIGERLFRYRDLG